MRYFVKREIDKRQDLDLRADFKVNNQLTVYAKGSYNKRHNDINQLAYGLGNLAMANGQPNTVPGSVTVDAAHHVTQYTFLAGAARTDQLHDIGLTLVVAIPRQLDAALEERERLVVADFRVDDDCLGVVALARKGVAGHLLERDLFRPTDVHEAVEWLGFRSVGDLGGHLVGGDRLDQRVGNVYLVPDDQ